MEKKTLEKAIACLKERYDSLDWSQHETKKASKKIVYWPGDPKEDIVVTVHKSKGAGEPFHYHDYFYFNYAYKGSYDSFGSESGCRVTIHENEVYAGQPFAGHALCTPDNQETVLIGLLVQKSTFFRAFLPMVSSNSRLFRFFLEPSTNQFSDTFFRFQAEDPDVLKSLLEIMVVEYADKREDTQEILRPLALAFFLQIARQHARLFPAPKAARPSEQILEYIGGHLESVTLKDVALRFSYHPNYISALLRRELGKTFTEILLTQRMERARLLLQGTDLTVEAVARLVGYKDSGNFYKAFREYYHRPPRGASL